MSEELELSPEETSEPQEPPKFSVKTVIDAKIQLEASRALRKKSANVLCYLCFAVLIAVLGWTVWQFIQTRSGYNLTMCLFVLLAIGYMIYIYFAMPKRALRRWEKSVIRTYGSPEFHLTTEFYNYSLAQTLEEKQTVTVQGYSELSDLQETEHLFLLRHAKNSWFFVNKKGFETGSPEEFREFITKRIGV